MTYVIVDFVKEKKHLKKMAIWTIITVFMLLAISLGCYFSKNSYSCVFFGVLSGLTFEFLFLIIAERLELNNHKDN
jgi:hypothetical protein